jgi:hypothetical protein
MFLRIVINETGLTNQILLFGLNIVNLMLRKLSIVPICANGRIVFLVELYRRNIPI